MRVARATAEEAGTLHALQSRYLLYDTEAAKIVKPEDAETIRRSLASGISLIATQRRVAVGAIRAKDKGRVVYIDALWVPFLAKRSTIGVLLLLSLEERFVSTRVYQIRAVHGDLRCFRVYAKAGYQLVYEEKRQDGLVLRWYEKHPGSGS